MKIKLLIVLAGLFYIAASRTGEMVWRFCLIYSCALVVCAFFYRLENKKGAKISKR
jgi:hypothetical protein